MIALVLAAAATAQQRPQQSSLADLAFAKLQHRYDTDHDGRIDRGEYPRGDAAFANLDRDGDGAITRADFDVLGRRARVQPRGRARGAGKNGASAAQIIRAQQPPKVGDRAPDFTLPMLGMKDTTVQLSSFRGQQPVALIFGSWT